MQAGPGRTGSDRRYGADASTVAELNGKSASVESTLSIKQVQSSNPSTAPDLESVSAAAWRRITEQH